MDKYNLLVPMYLMSNYLYLDGPMLDKPVDTVLTDSQYDKVCVMLLRHWDEIDHPHKELIYKNSLVTATGSYLQNKLPKRIQLAALAWVKCGLTEEQRKLLKEDIPMENPSEQVYVLTPYDLESVVTAKVVINRFNGYHLSISRKKGSIPYASNVYVIKPFISFNAMAALCKEYSVTLVNYTDSSLYNYRDKLDCKQIWIERTNDGKCLFEEMYNRLNPNKEYPKFFEYVRDYTRWTLLDDNTLSFKYGLSTMDVVFKNQEVYNKLLANDKDTLNEIVNIGTKIREYMEIYNRVVSNMTVVPGRMKNNGEYIAAANAALDSLLFVDYVPEKINADLVVTFHPIPFKHTTNYTLYRIQLDVDVGEIARRYGGGGYAGCANIQSEESPIEFDFENVTEIKYSSTLFDKKVYTENIDKYFRENVIPRKYTLTYGEYEGKRAVFSNTPFLPPYNFFNICHHVSGVYYGVCWFMISTGMVVELVRRMDEGPMDLDTYVHVGGGWYWASASPSLTYDEYLAKLYKK